MSTHLWITVEENWFQELLKREMADRKMNVTDFARFLGVVRETCDRWVSDGKKPDVLVGTAVLQKLGWNFDRARPDWQPEPVGPIPTEPILATVAAGSVDYADPQELESVEAWPGQWRHSPLWDLTDPVETLIGKREIALLRIAGNSMEPDYRDGEIIAGRTPKDPKRIPDGTPCIIRHKSEGQTFKLLRWAVGGYIVGEPINKEHRPIVFPKIEEVSVILVVLGKLDPGTHSAVSTKNTLTVLPKGVRKGLK